MITMPRDLIDKFISIQKQVIRGKEKFIHYLRDMDVQNVENVQTFMHVNPEKKFRDAPQMYITLWTPRIYSNALDKFLSTGEYDNTIMLSFHVSHQAWYYSMSKVYSWNELPLFIKEYLTVHFFEDLAVDPVFKFSGSYFGTCCRNYRPLMEHYSSLRDMIFSNLGYQVLEQEQIDWVDNQLHPRGEYIKHYVRTETVLTFDEIIPSFGDDAFFNAQLLGIDDQTLYASIYNAQYCNLKGFEMISPSITQNFWMNLEKQDEL